MLIKISPVTTIANTIVIINLTIAIIDIFTIDTITFNYPATASTASPSASASCFRQHTTTKASTASSSASN